MTGFVGLDDLTCSTALAIVIPTIEHLITALGAEGGSLVVFYPKPYETGTAPAPEFSKDFGRDKWMLNYEMVATQKGWVSIETGLPSSIVQQRYPYLYKEGMVKWGGTAVGMGGLVVAFSGLKQEYDEMIAEMMLSAITAECRFSMRDVMASDSHYLGR